MISKENNCTSVGGFTIVELMAVVVIIVLISSVSIIAINRARDRTRDAVITSSLEQLIAIGETVYSPTEEYKEFYDMRESKHPRIEEIRDRIRGVGREFNFNFPKDISAGEQPKGDYSEFCAWAPLFSNPGEKFCIDYRGEIVITKERVNCEIVGLDYDGIREPRNCDHNQ